MQKTHALPKQQKIRVVQDIIREHMWNANLLNVVTNQRERSMKTCTSPHPNSYLYSVLDSSQSRGADTPNSEQLPNWWLQGAQMGLILVCCDTSAPHHSLPSSQEVSGASARESQLSAFKETFVFSCTGEETWSCHSTCKLVSIGKVQRPDYLHFAESCTTQQKKAKMQLNQNGSISDFFFVLVPKQSLKKKKFLVQNI